MSDIQTNLCSSIKYLLENKQEKALNVINSTHTPNEQQQKQDSEIMSAHIKFKQV
jgi:hypothetical protein